MFYPMQTGGIASLMSGPYGQPMTTMAPRQMAPQTMAPQTMVNQGMSPMGQQQMAPQQPQMQPFGMQQGFVSPQQPQGQAMPQQAYMQLPAAIPSPAATGVGQHPAYGMYGGGQVRRMNQGGLAYLPLMYRGV